MSKECMKIGSDNTFNGGSYGCIVVYTTVSATQGALTGYGYLYCNIFVSKTKKPQLRGLIYSDIAVTLNTRTYN
jgi:hypothetical protein